MSAIARKYTLQRIKKGDYIFLANDGASLWRVATYHEDGSAVTDGGKVLKGLFWGTWKYLHALGAMTVDPEEWNDWEMRECLLWSRAEAIQCALFEAARGDA